MWAAPRLSFEGSRSLTSPHLPPLCPSVCSLPQTSHEMPGLVYRPGPGYGLGSPLQAKPTPALFQRMGIFDANN